MTKIWTFIFENLFSSTNLIIFVLLGVLVGLYFENYTLSLENDKLKLEKLHFQSEILASKEEILKQNQAFEKVKLDLKPQNEVLKEVLKVEKIFIKDKSCANELKAYKELFSVLGAKQ